MLIPLIMVLVSIGSALATSNDPQCHIDIKLGMHHFYNVGNEFVKLVQPKAFPVNIIKDFIDSSKGGNMNRLALEELGKQVLLYEVGYLVLMGIGAIFIIIMSIVGICFCCCLCCNKCGGEKYQSEPVSTGSCATLTVLCTLMFTFMFTGVVMFSLNAKYFLDAVIPSRDNSNDQINRVFDFIHDTIDDLVRSTDPVFRDSMAKADDIHTMLAHNLIDSLKKFSNVQNLLYITTNVSQLVDGSNSVNSAIEEYNNAVLAVAGNANTFAGQVGTLSPDRAQIVADIAALTNPEFATEFRSMVIRLEQFQTSLDFTSMINTERRMLRSMERRLNSAVGRSTASITETYDTYLSNLRKAVNYITDYVTTEKDYIINNTVSTSNIADHSFVPHIILAAVVPICLILLFLFCGLCIGTLSYDSTKRPFERTWMSDVGGHCLIWSVVVIFMFTWLLMCVTMIFFSVGFLTQTLICTPLFQDPQQLNTLTVIQIDHNTPHSKNGGSALYAFNISFAINHCKANDTLYTSLRLSQVTDRSKIIKFADGAIDEIKFLYFYQADVYKLDPQTYSSLTQAAKNLWEVQANISAFVNANLKHSPTYALGQVQAAIDGGLMTGDQLQKANALVESITRFQPAASSLQDSLISLDASIDTLIGLIKGVEGIDTSMLAATSLAEANQDIATAITSTDKLIRNYTNQVMDLVEHNIGNCRPLYDIFSCVGDILCKQMLYPLQGIWIALGWCLLWSIPTVVWAAKLSTYFRKMEPRYYEGTRPPLNVFEDQENQTKTRLAWLKPNHHGTVYPS